MDIVRVSKTIRAPLPFVFSWCTDFSEDDPKLTGSTSERIMLRKTRKSTIYAQIYRGLDGKRKVGVSFVELRPPSSWHLDYFGEEDEETGEYRLKNLGKDRTRLDMVFKEKWKKSASRIPSVREQTRDTSKLWDKYVAALERDYISSEKRIARGA